MKTTLFLLPLAGLLASSNCVAAPKITEIRLDDVQGRVAPPRKNNTFTFRSSGTFDWLEGTVEKPVTHH